MKFFHPNRSEIFGQNGQAGQIVQKPVGLEFLSL